MGDPRLMFVPFPTEPSNLVVETFLAKEIVSWIPPRPTCIMHYFYFQVPGNGGQAGNGVIASSAGSGGGGGGAGERAALLTPAIFVGMGLNFNFGTPGVGGAAVSGGVGTAGGVIAAAFSITGLGITTALLTGVVGSTAGPGVGVAGGINTCGAVTPWTNAGLYQSTAPLAAGAGVASGAGTSLTSSTLTVTGGAGGGGCSTIAAFAGGAITPTAPIPYPAIAGGAIGPSGTPRHGYTILPNSTDRIGNPGYCSLGGAGGGATFNSTPGGDGGNAGFGGGGGGGGACSGGSNLSGKGGDGGPGFLYVVSW